MLVRIYLDNCCFNRHYDDQNYIRIRLETEAKLYIQDKIKLGEIELVWSYILEQENEDNPFEDKRENIQQWVEIAIMDISESENILTQAESFFKIGSKNKDALHIACAIASGADYFITTDKGILKKRNAIFEIQIVNPIDFLNAQEDV
ncbi:MAG: PIN domain-containing protein [Leptospiraceae bacterium]|nr:PIN domain-containing protein [Leptospiraceae bacterium]